MKIDKHPAPRDYKGVMVSSTFKDLMGHRAAIINAIKAQGLMPAVMENDSARPAIDVIDSSLDKVRDGSAYVALISHKYGQIPECIERNPDRLSLTELEFNEAQRLGRPVLLFIMGDYHQVKPGHVERDPEKIKSLEAFRENAKRLKSDSSVHRVYKVFNDLHEFEVAANQSVAELRRYLDEQSKLIETSEPPPQGPPKAIPETDPIPSPPALYAEPPYIGSHEFVGRERELITLDEWASAADPYSVLLFEAIGGAGKSMVTWEWVNKWATTVREDWAGRFWYSFYERGADMSDFCRRAMAYVTQRPLSDFRGQKTTRLARLLVAKLQSRPWLLILDGLERVLVAYNRFDAAQVADEKAGTTDEIADRDPCAAIRPEDDDLIRALASAAPSKLLLTSRLIPRVLLNSASQPIPGFLRERLPGLRPTDAEALLRACGVRGTSSEMQNYLKSHCDCHPLVTGIVAGLINNYLPDRANFDSWAADPDHGGQINLANLDLVQKRNHILRAALVALTPKSRQLLFTLALLSEAVDYHTLNAINPHGPRAAPEELAKTVLDLERRGLLQYDGQAKRYDLHPVVRGVAAGGLRQEEKERYGQRVVDHFSQQAHLLYEEAETLDDLRDGIQIVRTLLQMGRFTAAISALSADLHRALFLNLEAYAEALSLYRPFFPQGWATLPDVLTEPLGVKLVSNAAWLLRETGELEEALVVFGVSLLATVRRRDWDALPVSLANIGTTLFRQGRLARAESYRRLYLDVATLVGSDEDLFSVRLDLFAYLTELGKWKEAHAMWQLLDPMGRNWPREVYRPGSAEYWYARFHFWQGDLREQHLAQAEKLAKEGRSRAVLRRLHGLRGEWQLYQGEWERAAASCHEAVRMGREVGQTDAKAEAKLTLAKFHLNQLTDPRHEAVQLANAKDPAHRFLADLWLAIGDAEQAEKHAIAAYKWAWADGEPYVHRYELNRARALLEQLAAKIPNLPPYDAANYEKFPWEDEVAAGIEKLRAEKGAESTTKNPPKEPRKNPRRKPRRKA